LLPTDVALGHDAKCNTVNLLQHMWHKAAEPIITKIQHSFVAVFWESVDKIQIAVYKKHPHNQRNYKRLIDGKKPAIAREKIACNPAMPFYVHPLTSKPQKCPVGQKPFKGLVVEFFIEQNHMRRMLQIAFIIAANK
jgi:hypothetical protein